MAPGKYVFQLFVTGQTNRAIRAIHNLRRFCEIELDGQCDVSIIDVLEQPDQAEKQKILATPTLIKVSPPPMRRIIGDLGALKASMLGLHRLADIEETES
jgi:circadian clock protein KaiB